MKVILFLALLALAFGITETEYHNAFTDFKQQYGKTYLNPAEEQHRYSTFKANFDFVANWDSNARGFEVGINQFADLTSSEFVSIYNGMNVTRQPVYRAGKPTDVNVDWRTKGAVTGVKDQGQCGSCWSFSATGSIQAAHFFKNGALVSLSEQNLVDCSTAQGNQGCNGGLMDSAFQYVIDNHGIDTEQSYPYTATGPNRCKFTASAVGATVASFTDIASGNENDLTNAINGRPVSVAIDASHNSFQLYKSGIYYEPKCSSSQLDHGVLAVGYGSDGGSDYYIVKNSWGAGWGNMGYLQMSRNRNNNCGIATAASYSVA
jgi:cathepsin L